jgi:hypothetical protein
MSQKFAALFLLSCLTAGLLKWWDKVHFSAEIDYALYAAGFFLFFSILSDVLTDILAQHRINQKVEIQEIRAELFLIREKLEHINGWTEEIAYATQETATKIQTPRS